MFLRVSVVIGLKIARKKTFRHVRLVTRKGKRSRVRMEETISKDNILISRKKAAQERKLQKKTELDRAYYLQNREKKIAQVKQRRQEK